MSGTHSNQENDTIFANDPMFHNTANMYTPKGGQYQMFSPEPSYKTEKNSTPVHQKIVFNANSAFKSPCIKLFNNNSSVKCNDFNLQEMEYKINNNTYNYEQNIDELKDSIKKEKQAIQELQMNNEDSYQEYSVQQEDQHQSRREKQEQKEYQYKERCLNQFDYGVEPPQQTQVSKKQKMCNCKKTKCLKLYCDCFASGELCGPECNCYECCNTQRFQNQRSDAIVCILDRQPEAFSAKFKNDQKTKKVVHKKGCHCKHSKCLKKYCECYGAGIKCNDQCKCEDCKNTDQNLHRKRHHHNNYNNQEYRNMDYRHQIQDTILKEQNHEFQHNLMQNIMTPSYRKDIESTDILRGQICNDKTQVKKQSFIKRSTLNQHNSENKTSMDQIYLSTPQKNNNLDSFSVSPGSNSKIITNILIKNNKIF